MAKFDTKNLVVIIIFGILLIGTVAIVNAQQALPKGGDSFGTAVKIESGNYVTDHDISRKVPEYFKLTVGAGQILSVKVTNLPTGVDIISHTVLYNEDRAMLLPSYDNPLDNIYGAGLIGIYRWLPNSSHDSYMYYMSVGGGDVNFTAEGTKYDISIEDRFDAGSQTDAGDSFEKAMSISPGEYTAYLSGEAGTDTKDFYKTAVQNGETLTAKVTPEGEARMRVVVYDNNRQVLKDEYAPNPGAIITNSVARTRSGDVFIAVICEEWCSESVATYTLSITKEAGAEAPVGEEEEEEEEVLTGESTGWTTGEGLTEEEAEEAAKGFFKVVLMAWLLPLVVGLISLVVVIVVIVVLVRKKKK